MQLPHPRKQNVNDVTLANTCEAAGNRLRCYRLVRGSYDKYESTSHKQANSDGTSGGNPMEESGWEPQASDGENRQYQRERIIHRNCYPPEPGNLRYDQGDASP